MKTVFRNIPYRLCDHIVLQEIDNWCFYVDLKNGIFLKLAKSVHEWIISEKKEECEQNEKIANHLIKHNYIEPDLSKIMIGKMSIYVQKNKKNFSEHITIKDIYIDNITTIDLLRNKNFLGDSVTLHFIFNGNQKIPKNFDFNGEIILNSYSPLETLKNIHYDRLRIESDQIPSDQDLMSLLDILKLHIVCVVLPYGIKRRVAQKIVNQLSVLDSNNLLVSYDSCCVSRQSDSDFSQAGKALFVERIPHLSLLFPKISCGAGKHKCYIDALGNVFSCYRLRFDSPIYSIRDGNREGLLEKFRDTVFFDNSLECNSCSVRYFCGRGCKAEYDQDGYIYCASVKHILSETYRDKSLSANTKRFDLDLVKKQKDLSIYQYMCERNAIRVLLIGYGIKEPLLLMRCGLFIKDQDFYNTGHFSTSFARALLNAAYIPILGEIEHSPDWEVIDSHLLKGFPVLVTVDVFFLPYKGNTYYHSKHGAHSIILLKKNQNKYTVLDWYPPDYYIGEISKDDLSLARASTNEKNELSAFSGEPIQNSYRLLYMNNLDENFNIVDCIKSNLYESSKNMISPIGALNLYKQAYEAIPLWVKKLDYSAYENAIESFFLLELELKLLKEYFFKIATSLVFQDFKVENLLERVEKITEIVCMIKTKFLIALRKQTVIEDQTWIKLFKQLYKELFDYCEAVLLMLNSTKKKDKKETL